MQTDGRRAGVFLLSCVGLAAVIAIDAWLFRWIADASYFAWYLEKGAIISLGATFVALVVEGLELQRDLVSAHPLRYVAACFGIAGIFFLALSVHFRPVPARAEDQTIVRAGGRLWDTLVTVALGVPLFVLVLAWVVVVAPLNYVVTLVSGALARQQLRGLPTRCVVVERDGRVVASEEAREAALPDGAVDVSLSRKPIALTQGLTAVVLWLVDLARTAWG